MQGEVGDLDVRASLGVKECLLSRSVLAECHIAAAFRWHEPHRFSAIACTANVTGHWLVHRLSELNKIHKQSAFQRLHRSSTSIGHVGQVPYPDPTHGAPNFWPKLREQIDSN